MYSLATGTFSDFRVQTLGWLGAQGNGSGENILFDNYSITVGVIDQVRNNLKRGHVLAKKKLWVQG